MAVTDAGFDEAELDPPVRPPTYLLYVSGGVLVVAVALVPFASTVLRVVAYVLAALISSVVIGVFRYVDSRRKARAGYRNLAWSGPTAVVLLAAGWILSCTSAWLLATTWAR